MLISMQSSAEERVCYDPDAMTKSLLTNGFIPIASMDVDKLPAILYANPISQEYIVFILTNDVLCAAGSGRAFHLYERRKA